MRNTTLDALITPIPMHMDTPDKELPVARATNGVFGQDRACTSLVVAGSGVGLALWPMRALPHGVVMVA
jgi:hypothetical protein